MGEPRRCHLLHPRRGALPRVPRGRVRRLRWLSRVTRWPVVLVQLDRPRRSLLLQRLAEASNRLGVLPQAARGRQAHRRHACSHDPTGAPQSPSPLHFTQLVSFA